MIQVQFTHEEDRLDSDMQTNEPGSPVTLGECELAAAGADRAVPAVWSYAFLLRFLIRRVKRLFYRVAQLEAEVELVRELNQALRDNNEELRARLGGRP